MNLSSALTLDGSQVGNPIVAKLSELLDDRDLDVRTKVAEGLCKLMMSKVITSSKLFTRLILMWYNPVTNPNGRLRHVLGAFFPLYASMSKENQDSISEVCAFILISLSLKCVYILIHTEWSKKYTNQITVVILNLWVSNYLSILFNALLSFKQCFDIKTRSSKKRRAGALMV